MKILVIAPHHDDEVLGCGGTIAKMARKGHEVYTCIVTTGLASEYGEKIIKTVRNEDKQASCILGVHDTYYLDFPASHLDRVSTVRLNAAIEDVVFSVSPDEVYIPHYGDIHMDHKAVAESCMVALRPKTAHKPCKVYAYETLSETGWDVPNAGNAFLPNSYSDIGDTLGIKLLAMSKMKSQLKGYPSPRSLDAMSSLAYYRGSTVGFFAAEAFQLIREIRG
jgi:LmbE family N-acetylglucosaminyl deacetylase